MRIYNFFAACPSGFEARLPRLRTAAGLCAALLLAAISPAEAQETVRQLSGTVRDEAGRRLEGVSVSARGGTGTHTGSDGSFRISAYPHAVLEISSVGYAKKNVPVEGQTVLDIVLTEASGVLDEVVVVGYTAQAKKEITGSVAIVAVEDMKSIPASSPVQMLQGRASGLSVITSGRPGAGSTVRIRGITAFSNNTPLMIIDGVQGELTDINANDIESVQVLKDAGAAAIYGVRGANGVVIVTTKRGKAGAARISYNGTYGVQTPPGGNVFNLLNTQEMADLTWKALINAGQVDANGNPTHVQYGNGPVPVIPDYILVGPDAGVVGELTQAQIDSYNIDHDRGKIYQIVPANKQGTDWFHEIFRSAPTQDHSVSASSANNKSSYFFSAGYFDQQGTMMNTYLKRYSLRANTTFNIKDNVRIGESLYFFKRDTPSSSSDTPISEAYQMQPIIPVFDLMGNYAGTAAKGLGNIANPYATAERNLGRTNTSSSVQGNVFAEVDFLRHFTAKTTFGGYLRNGYTNSFTRRTYENAENNAVNSYSEGSSLNQQWTLTNTLRYDRKLGRHQVKALLGLEAVENLSRSVSGSRRGYYTDDPDFVTLSTGSTAGIDNSSSRSMYALYSQFGKLDYSFAERYIAAATLRRDGSSRFGSRTRWGFFPSFSAGWRLSEEPFMGRADWLSNLMVRGSWGVLGSQQNVGADNAFTQYTTTVSGSYYDIAGTGNKPVQGFRMSRFGNLDTGWEEDILSNIGLDIAVLNAKLDFSVEYYEKRVNGLLFDDKVPGVAGGASVPKVNIGDIENKGVDFNANYHLKNGEFGLDLGLNLTHYKSRVVDIPGEYYETGNTRAGNFVRNQMGHPVGAFFGYRVERLFRDAQDVAESPAQTAAAPGRFKYADTDGDGKISPEDRTFIGDPNPDFTYGLNVNANYKGFGLTMFFYGSQGNDLVNARKWFTDFYATFAGAKSGELLYSSWRPDNLNAQTPIAENSANFSNSEVANSYYVEKASFLKMRNAMLSYQFGGKGLSRLGIEQLRMYLQVVNPFTITKYSGMDPDIGASSGIDSGNYPNNQRSYNVGVGLTF